MQQLALDPFRSLLGSETPPAPAARRPPRRKVAKAPPSRRDRWLWPELAPPVRTRKLRQVPARRNRAGHKPVSMGTWPLTDDERAELAEVEYELRVLGIDERMPRTLGECRPGPCPFVQCTMNLYLTFVPSREVTPDGKPKPPSIIRNFPDREVWELAETCALRVANAAEEANEETSIEDVARLINLTHERARQIEKGAIEFLGPAVEALRRNG
jgi:hypothetical protein